MPIGFRDTVQSAVQVLSDGATPDHRRALQAVAGAFLGVYSRAKDTARNDLAACTPDSIRAAVVTCATLRLYPTATGPTPIYLVPQRPRRGEAPQLEARINVRGISILAARAGAALVAFPVARTDRYVVSMGELVEHDMADPTAYPERVEDLAGVGVRVRLSTGLTLCAWVPVAVIVSRRALSQGSHDGAPWKRWPVEMAMGAAVRYAHARGMVPIDSPELQAAMAGVSDEEDAPEPAPEVAPAVSEATPAPAPKRTRAPRQLPEHLPEPEIIEPEPERVPVADDTDDEATGWDWGGAR